MLHNYNGACERSERADNWVDIDYHRATSVMQRALLHFAFLVPVVKPA